MPAFLSKNEHWKYKLEDGDVGYLQKIVENGKWCGKDRK